MAVVIGGVSFRNNAELKRHVAAIVSAKADGELLPEAEFGFVVDLIRRRHAAPDEKLIPSLADQVVGIRVRHQSGCPQWGRSKTNVNHLFVVYADGSEIDFSWRRCCENDFSPERDADQAMRRAVVPDIIAYKKERFLPVGGQRTCAVTGADLSWGTCQVDHWPLTWVAIRDRFLADEGVGLGDVAVTKHPLGGHILADARFAERFIGFHRREAKLRLVTAEVNRKSWRDKEAQRV